MGSQLRVRFEKGEGLSTEVDGTLQMVELEMTKLSKPTKSKGYT